jgi:hypothetical protein
MRWTAVASRSAVAGKTRPVPDNGEQQVQRSLLNVSRLELFRATAEDARREREA